MSEIAIGIDLGTSNSCVALLQGREVEVLTNAYGEPITASVVALREDGSITVGNAAKANIIHDPKHTVYSSKRLMGRYYFSEEVKKAQAICSYEIAEGPNHGVRIRVREELFSLPEIGAMILRELKCIAEARLGQPVSKAVITVPANFNDNQRQATKDAGRIAGLEVLRILNEPTAAALAYGFGKGLKQTVAIYDLGGGTFDISVLEIGDDVFEVLATRGDTFLGGDDFDDRLIDLLADEFMEREGINLRNDPFALEKLKVAAESAKKALSMDESVEIRIPDVVTAPDGSSSLSIERTLTAEDFGRLVSDLVQRTFKVCDEALQQAGVLARDLGGVILVGGPTRLPVIRAAVRDYFQQDTKADVDPDQVVAMGAAIHAATLVDTDREAFLLDVTPLSLRIGVAGGLAESIIEGNTPVPIEQTRTFTTFQDDQESVVIRVYQGESRDVEGNELLGQFEFSGFKKARRGEVQIDVSFEINADGIVNVTASDPETGQAASTRITLSSGLSEGELQEIIEEARTDRLEPTSGLENSEPIGAVELVQRPATRVPRLKEALPLPPPREPELEPSHSPDPITVPEVLDAPQVIASSGEEIGDAMAEVVAEPEPEDAEPAVVAEPVSVAARPAVVAEPVSVAARPPIASDPGPVLYTPPPERDDTEELELLPDDDDEIELLDDANTAVLDEGEEEAAPREADPEAEPLFEAPGVDLSELADDSKEH